MRQGGIGELLAGNSNSVVIQEIVEIAKAHFGVDELPQPMLLRSKPRDCSQTVKLDSRLPASALP